MSSERKSTEGKTTRREFLNRVVPAGLAVGAAGVFSGLEATGALERDHILIGHPNPSTGMLAEFGAISPWADDRVMSAINAQGGIFIKEYGKKLPVRVKVVDTQSDPSRAEKIATDLIVKNKIDIMVVMHTPDTVNPVSKVCEKNKVPSVSMVVPLESWLSAGPFEWCYHAFWSVDSLSELFLGMWDQYADRTSRVFGGLWPDDPDGKVWADIFSKKLKARGYRVVDPGRYSYWTPDFTEMINLFKREKVDIIGGVPIPPDWANFWRQARQDDFHPSMAAISKAMAFPGAANSLPGSLASGIISELWWSPFHPFASSVTGETSEKLSTAWTKDTGAQWTMPLGFGYAGMEIAVDAIRRAQSLDKEKIRQALAATDLATVVGRIRFRDDHCCETPLVAGQWFPGTKWPWELGITYNKMQPEIQTTAQFVFPIPK
ncbi:MAG: ABC transporter substrate-binding protein [Pseudomonadota bacterium]